MYNHETNKDIVYLDYKTSAVANWGLNNTSMSDSLINIIKDSKIVYAEEIIPINVYKAKED